MKIRSRKQTRMGKRTKGVPVVGLWMKKVPAEALQLKAKRMEKERGREVFP